MKYLYIEISETNLEVHSFAGFVQGTLMNIWTSSLTYTLPRMQWFRLVLQSPCTFTRDQVLHWVQFHATCSHGRWLGWSNQRLYLQQRVQLHSILSVPSYRPRDWILLQSMSLDLSDYGWTLGVHGYEPVLTVDPMAPEELLQLTSCNCKGDCNNRRRSCKKNGVKYISACGVFKGITCKNGIHDGVEEDSNIDSWSFWYGGSVFAVLCN